MLKNQHVKQLRFSLNTNQHMYPKNVYSKSPVHGFDPSFCSLTDTKQSLQYTIKTHLSGPPVPKFKANMNYIPQALPAPRNSATKVLL